MESYFLCLPNHNYFKRWWASVTNIFKLNEQIGNQLGGKGKPALISLLCSVCCESRIPRLHIRLPMSCSRCRDLWQSRQLCLCHSCHRWRSKVAILVLHQGQSDRFHFLSLKPLQDFDKYVKRSETEWEVGKVVWEIFLYEKDIDSAI